MRTALHVGAALVLLASLVGCAVQDQVAAARAVISPDQVPGVDQPHHIGWSWPERSDKPFSEVDSHSFFVQNPSGGPGTPIFVVEGKDAKTNQWQVVYAAKKVNDNWVPIQLNDVRSKPQAARAAQAAVVEPEYMEAADILKVQFHGFPPQRVEPIPPPNLRQSPSGSPESGATPFLLPHQ